jgi:hypothetical protein
VASLAFKCPDFKISSTGKLISNTGMQVACPHPFEKKPLCIVIDREFFLNWNKFEIDRELCEAPPLSSILDPPLQ